MPGGRGTIVDIAVGLNNAGGDTEAQVFTASIKSWIDTGGYRVSGVTLNQLAAATDLCKRADQLQDIWCHALMKGAVDAIEY